MVVSASESAVVICSLETHILLMFPRFILLWLAEHVCRCLVVLNLD